VPDILRDERKLVVRAIKSDNLLKHAIAGQQILDTLWIGDRDATGVMINALKSLENLLVSKGTDACDKDVHEQLIAIGDLWNAKFEGGSIGKVLMKILVVSLYDTFVSSCTKKLQAEVEEIGANQEYLFDRLNQFESFLNSGSAVSALAQDGNFPENSNSIMDLLKNLNKMQYRIIVANSCMLLSKDGRVERLSEEVSDLARILDFQRVDDESWQELFEDVAKFVASYKICMKANELL